MYNIALIQNDSEMLRYSWVDARPFLNRFTNYHCDLYTGENIHELFYCIDKYDAIFISTNSCNDRKVYNALVKNKNTIQEFLNDSKGLLITHQMKKKDCSYYEYLPKEFLVESTNRILELNEKVVEGDIDVPSPLIEHPVLLYPHKIDIKNIKNHCLSNNMVEGLYWCFLKAGQSESYLTLLVDSSYEEERQIMLVSRNDFPFRIVVTTLALDWQMHYELLENALKYVVEGKPSIAVIYKEKSKLSNFEFEYFISNLKLNKIPFSAYYQSELKLKDIRLDIHDMIVLDPNWSEKDLKKNDFGILSNYLKKGNKIIYQERTPFDNPKIVTIGGINNFDMISQNTLDWLHSKFEDGRWGKSFWVTLDVLDTLTTFNQPIQQYKESILEFIKRHKVDGSYDNVFGATCGMLKIYSYFLDKNDSDFRIALNWIKKKIKTITLYETATGIDILNQLEIPIGEGIVKEFRENIVKKIPEINDELSLHRYAKTLVSCGFLEDAKLLLLKLKDFQDTYGKWRNIPTTAAIVDLLLQYQENVKRPSKIFNEMIFKGVIYLKECYKPDTFWGINDLTSSAKALKALKSFERRLRFSIDEILLSIKNFSDFSRNLTGLEIASQLNNKLQKEKTELNKIIKEKSEFKLRLTKLSHWFASALILITTFLACYFAYIVSEIIPEWTTYFLPIVCLSPLIIIMGILREYDILPKRLTKFYGYINEKIIGKIR